MTYKPHNVTITEEFRLNGCLSLESQEKIVDIIDGLKDILNVSVNSLDHIEGELSENDLYTGPSVRIVMEDLSNVIEELEGV